MHRIPITRRSDSIPRRFVWAVLVLALLAAGCSPGSIIARQLRVAPNQQPEWLTKPGRWIPEAKVTLRYEVPDPARWITHQWASVGTPPVALRLGIIEPGHYGFEPSGRWETNKSRSVFRFEMRVSPDAGKARSTNAPRGTLFLLHGYGLQHDVLVPWGIALAEAGWRCVLVDLRGHGDSGGKTITFGIQETDEMIALVSELERRNAIAGPVGVLGDSYGAAIGIRWALRDPRIGTVVAMAPYDKLGDAMEGLRASYSRWVPAAWVRQAARELPRQLGVPSDALDTTSAPALRPVPAFLIAGDADPVASIDAVRRVAARMGPDTRVQVLPKSGHEEIPYEFDALLSPVREWFAEHLR